MADLHMEREKKSKTQTKWISNQLVHIKQWPSSLPFSKSLRRKEILIFSLRSIISNPFKLRESWGKLLIQPATTFLSLGSQSIPIQAVSLYWASSQSDLSSFRNLQWIRIFRYFNRRQQKLRSLINKWLSISIGSLLLPRIIKSQLPSILPRNHL